MLNTTFTSDSLTGMSMCSGFSDALMMGLLSSGWPLSSDDWDTQMLFFVQHGYRVIGIDRRGHGRSSQVSDGQHGQSRRSGIAEVR
jgi:hypothetical protein